MAEESIPELFQQLVADGKTVARSEIALAQARLAWRIAAAKSGAIAAVAALAFFHLLLIALVVGSLLMLTYALGPYWGSAIVCGVLLLLAAIFGYLAYSRLSHAFGSEDAR